MKPFKTRANNEIVARLKHMIGEYITLRFRKRSKKYFAKQPKTEKNKGPKGDDSFKGPTLDGFILHFKDTNNIFLDVPLPYNEDELKNDGIEWLEYQEPEIFGRRRRFSLPDEQFRNRLSLENIIANFRKILSAANSFKFILEMSTEITGIMQIIDRTPIHYIIFHVRNSPPQFLFKIPSGAKIDFYYYYNDLLLSDSGSLLIKQETMRQFAELLKVVTCRVVLSDHPIFWQTYIYMLPHITCSYGKPAPPNFLAWNFISIIASAIHQIENGETKFTEIRKANKSYQELYERTCNYRYDANRVGDIYKYFKRFQKYQPRFPCYITEHDDGSYKNKLHTEPIALKNLARMYQYTVYQGHHLEIYTITRFKLMCLYHIIEKSYDSKVPIFIPKNFTVQDFAEFWEFVKIIKSQIPDLKTADQKDADSRSCNNNSGLGQLVQSKKYLKTHGEDVAIEKEISKRHAEIHSKLEFALAHLPKIRSRWCEKCGTLNPRCEEFQSTNAKSSPPHVCPTNFVRFLLTHPLYDPRILIHIAAFADVMEEGKFEEWKLYQVDELKELEILYAMLTYAPKQLRKSCNPF